MRTDITYIAQVLNFHRKVSGLPRTAIKLHVDKSLATEWMRGRHVMYQTFEGHPIVLAEQAQPFKVVYL